MRFDELDAAVTPAVGASELRVLRTAVAVGYGDPDARVRATTTLMLSVQPRSRGFARRRLVCLWQAGPGQGF